MADQIPVSLRNILLIFIKNPRLGYVKTRLARTVGDAEALRIYRILLDKTRSAARQLGAERLLFYSDFPDREDEWAETEFEKQIQRGGDLGERMEAAFRVAFEGGPAKVLIIGSDCPGLTGDMLQSAFDGLDAVDFVIGPTSDGGYYLLGMKQLEPSLFRNIEWSTETVCSRTIEKIRAAGRSFALLPLLSDIDTEDDWLLYEKNIL